MFKEGSSGEEKKGLGISYLSPGYKRELNKFSVNEAFPVSVKESPFKASHVGHRLQKMVQAAVDQ